MANTTLAAKNKDALSQIHTKLSQDLVSREFVLHLPSISTYKIVRRDTNGGILAIQMGPYQGKPVFLTAEGFATSTGYRSRKINIQTGEPWDDSFRAPGVFNWKKFIRNGLREPMERCTLALVQYHCLLKSVADELELKVPVPQYRALLNAMQQLEDSTAFRLWHDETGKSLSTISGAEAPHDQESTFNGSNQSGTTMVARSPRSRSTIALSGNSRNHSISPRSAFSDLDIDLKVTAKIEPRRPSHQGMIDLDNDSIDFGNIEIPEREVQGQGLIRRSQMQATPAGAPSDRMRAHSLETDHESSDDEAVTKGRYRNFTPAGPEALQVLRQQIAPYLFSRLPDLLALKFSEHGKSINHARLRLLIGTYGQKNMLRWPNEVYAYFKFGMHPNYIPRMYMEVEQRFEGGHEDVEVTWENDIATNRVGLEDFAKKAGNNAELKALIKYCFLIATEAKLLGIERHFTSIRPTFINLLRTVCKEWDTRTADTEVSKVCYSDVSKTPAPLTIKLRDRGLRNLELSRPGVAQVKAPPIPEDDNTDSSEEEGNEMEESTKYNRKGTPSGWSHIQKVLGLRAASSLSRSSGYSAKHRKERRTRRKAKTSAVSRCSSANGRHTSKDDDDDDTESMITLKNEDRVLSGRIEKIRQEVEVRYVREREELQRQQAEHDEIKAKIRAKLARGSRTEAKPNCQKP
jgi:hypothetical protein